eukprot:GHVS01052185.1.p1 GENE.GHVS01052185.1~~GHVS01052185.1.p1  ORF type:complete len:665 (+),score=97.25 GHVS01052185.1:150-2144(+)
MSLVGDGIDELLGEENNSWLSPRTEDHQQTNNNNNNVYDVDEGNGQQDIHRRIRYSEEQEEEGDVSDDEITNNNQQHELNPYQIYVQEKFSIVGIKYITGEVLEAIAQNIREDGEAAVDEEKLDFIVDYISDLIRRSSSSSSGGEVSVDTVDSCACDYNDRLLDNELQPYREQFGQDAVVVYDAFKDIFDPTVQTSSVDKIRRDGCASFNNITGVTDCRLYRSRFQLLRRRCRGHPKLIFQDERKGVLVPTNCVVLNNVDAVNFADTNMQHLLGFLARDNDGALCLQGTRMSIHMTTESDCAFGSGMFCDGHIVIAAGRFRKDRKFWVTELIHPLRDVRCERSINDCLDLFGGSLSDDDMVRLNEFEWLEKHTDRLPSWVVMEEVFLDSPESIKCLHSLFKTFTSEYPGRPLPTGFVLTGNFSMSKKGGPRVEYLADHYASLFARFRQFMLNNHKLILQKCRLVFVPGPDDPGLGRRLVPRMGLVPRYTDNFADKIAIEVPEAKSNIIFATNPCRIRHFSARMVFFRRDVQSDISWHAMKLSQQQQQPKHDHAEHCAISLKDTIVGQAHLYPNKVDGGHIVKNLDGALRLFPLPEWVCLGDSSCPKFLMTAHDTKVTATTTCVSGNSDCIISNQQVPFERSRQFLVYTVSDKQLMRLTLPTQTT